MFVKNANQKYRKIRQLPDTGLIVETPDITDTGFTVVLRDLVERRNSRFELTATAESPVQLARDSIAVIIAALVLDKYKFINYQFAISEAALSEAKKLTSAVITATEITEGASFPTRNGGALNFSGGLDSTAALLLFPDLQPMQIKYRVAAPDPTAPVPTSAGAPNLLTVTTNASEFIFPHYPVGYYNLGTLMYADSANIGYVIDGRIMTDSVNTFGFLDGFYPEVLQTSEAYGVKVLYPFTGLTKAGIWKIIAALSPDKLQQASEASGFITGNPLLAALRDTLKMLLRKAITGELIPIDAISPVDWESAKKGGSLVFYAMYILNRLGVKEASFLIDGIPEDAVQLATSLRLDFYERYDPKALKNIPDEFASSLLERFEAAGIELYDENDYAERAQVLALIAGQEEP